MQIFVEVNAIAERVDHLHAPRTVKGRLDPRSQIFVIPAGDLAMSVVNAGLNSDFPCQESGLSIE